MAAEKDTKTPILALKKKTEALRFDATVGGFSSDGLGAICLAFSGGAPPPHTHTRARARAFACPVHWQPWFRALASLKSLTGAAPTPLATSMQRCFDMRIDVAVDFNLVNACGDQSCSAAAAALGHTTPSKLRLAVALARWRT